MRQAAGKTMEDVAETRILSRSKLHRIESGRATVKHGDVMSLARLSGVDLIAMADASGATGFQQKYGHRAASTDLGLYSELEGAAETICDYSTELLHGLLQTPAYARAVIGVEESLPPRVLERRVAFRAERQRRWFGRAEPGRLESVISQGVLDLVVGSRAVMDEQVAHLRGVS